MEIDYKEFHQAIELFFIGEHNNQEKAVFEMYDNLEIKNNLHIGMILIKMGSLTEKMYK
jgi:hypothetical protein